MLVHSNILAEKLHGVSYNIATSFCALKVWDTSHVAESYMKPPPVNVACFMESAPTFAILFNKLCSTKEKRKKKKRVLLHVYSL